MYQFPRWRGVPEENLTKMEEDKKCHLPDAHEVYCCSFVVKGFHQ